MVSAHGASFLIGLIGQPFCMGLMHVHVLVDAHLLICSSFFFFFIFFFHFCCMLCMHAAGWTEEQCACMTRSCPVEIERKRCKTSLGKLPTLQVPMTNGFEVGVVGRVVCVGGGGGGK